MATAGSPRVADPGEPKRDKRMSLGQHLVELRKRLMFAALALIVGMVVAFFITDWVIYLITGPIRDIAATEGESAKVELMFDTVTGAFDLRLRMSFAIGILISAPIWLWQIWAFIMPGLTRKEIKYTVGFIASAVPLFFAGCYVGLVVMPHILSGQEPPVCERPEELFLRDQPGDGLVPETGECLEPVGQLVELLDVIGGEP